MHNAQPISTAPRDGTPITVFRESHPNWGFHRLAWNEKSKRWEGFTFTTLRKVRIAWDRNQPQPTHWMP